MRKVDNFIRKISILGNANVKVGLNKLADIFPPWSLRRANTNGEIMRILIVDDNRDLADLLAILLTEKGHSCFTAYSAQDAMEIAFDLRPHLIILDICLPLAHGIEVARKLRADDHTWDVAILAHTSLTEESLAREGSSQNSEKIVR